MRRIIRSKHTYIALGLGVLFWVMARLVPNQLIILLTNCLVLAGSTAVGITYVPVAVRAIRSQAKPSVQHIALGIMYAWFFGALWRVWSLLWLTSGQQAWMVNNDVIAFFQAGVFLGACYHLTSPGAITGNMPQLKWIVLGVVCGIAVGLTALLVLTHPDTTAFVEALKPYVPR
jgi:hypothetical protein